MELLVNFSEIAYNEEEYVLEMKEESEIMFCNECGSTLKDEDIFCPSCGAKVVSDVSTESSVDQEKGNTISEMSENSVTEIGETSAPVTGENVTASAGENENVKKPRKSKKVSLIIAAILVIVLVPTVAFASPYMGNIVRKAITSPKSYYQYVEKKQIKEGNSATTETYKDYADNIKKDSVNSNVSIDFELGTSMQTLVNMLPIGFTGLENVQLDFNTSIKGDKEAMSAVAMINKKEIMSANASINMDTKEGYILVPELSESYLSLSSVLQKGEDEIESALPSSMGDYSEMVDKIKETIPDAKTFNSILNRYMSIVPENINKVTQKNKQSLTAAGVTEKYTKLSADISGKDVYKMLEEVIQTLKDDDDIMDIATGTDICTSKEYKDQMKVLKEKFSGEKDFFENEDMDVKMNIWVDAKGNIVGREFSGMVEGSDFVFRYAMPTDGSKFGLELSVDVDGKKYFTLSGSGKKSGSELSGDFTLNVASDLISSAGLTPSESDMSEVLKISVKKLDTKELKKGFLNGEFTFSTEIVPQISNYSMKMDVNSSKKESKMAATVLCEGDKICTLTVAISRESKAEYKEPSENDKIYDMNDTTAMESYVSEFSVDQLILDIKEKTGLEFELETITSLIDTYLGGNDDMGDYDMDDYDMDDYDLDDYDLDDYDLDDYDLDDIPEVSPDVNKSNSNREDIALKEAEKITAEQGYSILSSEGEDVLIGDSDVFKFIKDASVEQGYFEDDFNSMSGDRKIIHYELKEKSKENKPVYLGIIIDKEKAIGAYLEYYEYSPSIKPISFKDFIN